MAFACSAEQLAEQLRNRDQGWEKQLQQQRETRRLTEERATEGVPNALSSSEGANGLTVLAEVHANGQESLDQDRTPGSSAYGGCVSRPKHCMNVDGYNASVSAVREGLALPQCQTISARETENLHEQRDAFKTSSDGEFLVNASSEHLWRAEEESEEAFSRRFSGLAPPKSPGDDETMIHRVAIDGSNMTHEHCSTFDSSEGRVQEGSEGQNNIQGPHPLEPDGPDCGSIGVQVAHLREQPCSEVFPSRRSGSSEETTGACFPDRETGEYSLVSPPDSACKTAPRDVERGLICPWWKTDGLCFLENVR